MNRHPLSFLLSTLLAVGLAGCGGGGGDSGLQNKDPGSNDVKVVVAFGDSLTQGSECRCVPYPARVAALIGKTVVNSGASGTLATENIGRTQTAIDRIHPGFMLILYGVNDVIHSEGIRSIADDLDQMVSICKTNHVVPVLATYPEPIQDHAIFAPRVLLLNQDIRELAQTRGIHCVDLEPEFAANPEFYEPDGLHPNEAGTQIIALAFADLF